ncbi:MAG: phosphate ABC transporter permease family protein, partial [Geminicoccaceae bacterium]
MITTLIILMIAGAAYYYGWRRALDRSRGDVSILHSLPGHYAWYAAILAAGPALALWVGWSVFGDLILRWIVTASLPEDIAGQSPAMLDFFFADVRRMASGMPASGEVSPALDAAAALYGRYSGVGTVAFVIGTLALAIGLALIALNRIAPKFRARNRVENWITYGLLMTTAISVLITAGIVFSV